MATRKRLAPEASKVAREILEDATATAASRLRAAELLGTGERAPRRSPVPAAPASSDESLDTREARAAALDAKIARLDQAIEAKIGDVEAGEPAPGLGGLVASWRQLMADRAELAPPEHDEDEASRWEREADACVERIETMVERLEAREQQARA